MFTKHDLLLNMSNICNLLDIYVFKDVLPLMSSRETKSVNTFSAPKDGLLIGPEYKISPFGICVMISKLICKGQHWVKGLIQTHPWPLNERVVNSQLGPSAPKGQRQRANRSLEWHEPPFRHLCWAQDIILGSTLVLRSHKQFALDIRLIPTKEV